MLCRRCAEAHPAAPIPDTPPGSDAEELRCSGCGTELWLDKESQLARFGLFALRRPGWARAREEDDD